MDLTFKGFSKLSREERYELLKKMGLLSKSDLQLLRKSSFLNQDLAEDFIENSLGYFPMPYGVVTHLSVNGVERLVPMAVEETSIIAAASKTAKWIKESNGKITTKRLSQMGVGQIQIAALKNSTPVEIENLLIEKKQEWIDLCNSSAALSLHKRGGGVKDFKVRFIERPDGRIMTVFHVHVDTCEAMGANVINQVCEFMKPVLEEALNEDVTMCILSNLADTNLTEVFIELDVNEDLGKKIEEASLFAELDPYRASTNNKGIMNAIDSVLIATGNDWRAVEAGVHSFVGSNQNYTSLSQWRYVAKEAGKKISKEGKLRGTMILPMSIGTVGGVTTLHPFSKLSMKFLKSDNVSDLAGVIAAVGLVQNLGALRALTTVGIIEGHMKLHIRNLALGAGAKEEEAPALQQKLEQILQLTKRITLSQATEALTEIRQKIYTGSQDLTSSTQTNQES
jgi:hydroxymethylglutaryl-CoA reductase